MLVTIMIKNCPSLILALISIWSLIWILLSHSTMQNNHNDDDNTENYYHNLFMNTKNNEYHYKYSNFTSVVGQKDIHQIQTHTSSIEEEEEVEEDNDDHENNDDDNNNDDKRVMIQQQSQQKLPNFQGPKSGGVLLFYHIAKTGGTSIRNLFQKMAKEKPDDFISRRITIYDYTINDKDTNNTSITSSSNNCPPINYKAQNRMKNMISTVQSRLESKEDEESQRTMLLEIHGGEYGLKAMAEHINKWRNMSKLHNKPFFAFTLVRDPVSFSVSYFNYFHYGCTMPWCSVQYDNATEENLVKATDTHPNLQCFFLLHDLHASFYDRCKPTEEECDNVYEVMKQSLDWIGTTEFMTYETMPLLHYMLLKRTTKSNIPKHGKHEDKTNISVKGILKKLGKSTVKQLISRINLDSKIYQRVKHDYVFHELYANEIRGF